MFKIILTILSMFLAFTIAEAQILTQKVHGVVTDKENKIAIAGASIQINNTNLATISDENGAYIIDSVPIGKQQFTISYLGYKTIQLNNIEISSGKQFLLNLELEEEVTNLNEVTIKAVSNEQLSGNDMAIISARSFRIEETERYAGSRGDPSRMASNYAGVQGADDSRNDIVIRGNSPSSVLWRMEGIDIPNPNHFAIPGTSGGPVNVINNKLLANSDFYTSAFPAEYGNSTAGVFDLKLRNGNNLRHEQSFQLGILGTEAMVEGPLTNKVIKSKNATYLAMYRYATLDIFQKIGLQIGTDAVPKYQDFAFRVHVPLRRNQYLSLFGVGGKSNIYIMVSDQEKVVKNIYGQNDRDQYFESNVGWLGFTYSKAFNSHWYLKNTVALSIQNQNVHHELVHRHADNNSTWIVDSIVPLLKYYFEQQKLSMNNTLNYKSNAKLSVRLGHTIDIHRFTFQDAIREVNDTASINYYRFYKRWNTFHNQTLQWQPFIQCKIQPNTKLSIHLGWHGHYLQQSKEFSYTEPRMGLNYRINYKSMLSIGAGIHSQIQSPYLYFYALPQNNLQKHNEQIGMTYAKHLVLSYNYSITPIWQFKVETYYQQLYKVPIAKKLSSFSLANTGAGFSRFFPDTLVNNGFGENYGLEISLERAFHRNYYIMLNGTIYQSQYAGSDNVWRPTDFNGTYTINVLGAKEFIIKRHKAITIGTKVTTAGGRRYSPVDTLLSNYYKEVIDIDAEKNTLQLPAYFRADLKLGFKINASKLSHEIALDLVNVFNTKNVLKVSYIPNPQTGQNVAFDYQLGFLPLFYYKVDF